MEIRIDTSQMARAFQLLGSQANLALARAINRTAANAKTAMTKVVADDMGVKQAVVRDRISVWKADSTALRANLRAKSARLPLVSFGAKGPNPSRGRGAGVRVKLPAPGKGVYGSAFLATMRGGLRAGQLGVLQRADTNGGVSGHSRVARLPVYELYGPSVAKSFENHRDVAQARANEMLRKNVEHEIQYLVSQAKQ